MKFNLIEDLNRGINRFDYEITKEHNYKKLGELYNSNPEGIYVVRMFYTNKKSKFGENEVAVTDNWIVNLPKHLTETVEQIKKNEKYVDLINAGKFVFNVYEYEYAEGKKAYSVNWGTIG